MSSALIGLLVGWAIGSITVLWAVANDVIVLLPEAPHDEEDDTLEAINCATCGRLSMVEDMCYGECSECFAEGVDVHVPPRWPHDRFSAN